MMTTRSLLPRGSSITFDGVRSRCAMPCACTAAKGRPEVAVADGPKGSERGLNARSRPEVEHVVQSELRPDLLHHQHHAPTGTVPAPYQPDHVLVLDLLHPTQVRCLSLIPLPPAIAQRKADLQSDRLTSLSPSSSLTPRRPLCPVHVAHTSASKPLHNLERAAAKSVPQPQHQRLSSASFKRHPSARKRTGVSVRERGTGFERGSVWRSIAL
eukprot:433012-Rhodomonas_salina.2